MDPLEIHTDRHGSRGDRDRARREPPAQEVPVIFNEDDAVWLYYMMDRISKEDAYPTRQNRIARALRPVVKKRQGDRGITFKRSPFEGPAPDVVDTREG